MHYLWVIFVLDRLVLGVAGALVVLAILYLPFVFAVVIHELGHASAGSLAGIPIRSVQVGTGRPYFKFRAGSVTVSLAGFLLGGETEAYSIIHSHKPGLLAFWLGGVGFNAAAASILFLASRTTDSEPAIVLMRICAGAQFATALGNLRPFRKRDRAGRVSLSDGAWLRAWLRLDPKPLELVRTLMLAEFERYGAPPRKVYAGVVRAFTLLNEHGAADPEARRALAPALERELSRRHVVSVRLWLLDSLATRALFDDGDADFVRLAGWIEELQRLAPDLPTVRGTCGAALVLLGRHQEAKPGLLAAAEQGGPFDRFISMAFLARAEFALGDHEAAEGAMAECFRSVEANPDWRATKEWRLAESFAARIGWAPPAALPTLA